MKITIIKCSGGLNLGNNFINFGGEYVVRFLYPNSEIETFEFYDSCLPQWKSNEFLLKSSIDHIKKNSDLIFVLSGSAGGEPLFNSLYKPLDKLGIPFIPIGIGCEGKYDDSESTIMKKLCDLDNCKYVITRDPQTFDFISEKQNSISGIDLAFFAGDFLGNVKQDSDYVYAALNYEPYGYLPPSENYDLKKQLSVEFENIYLVENTVIPSRKDFENYVQIGYAEDLWRFYANSSLNVSSRIHTCVCSISNNVNFIYLGHHDQGGKKGRNTLFNKLDIELVSGQYYNSNDYQQKLKSIKKDYLDLLKNSIK
jgi:hypothetical protein